MKRAVALAVAFALCLSLVAVAEPPRTDATPGAPQAVVYDAPSAFEFLKTLVGDWERVGGGHQHGSAARGTTFRITAGGSSVLETILPGDPSEMLSVYHMDGDVLLLTHYCALHNAPILKFEKTDQPGVIKFVFHGGTNFDPKTDTHVHEGSFRIKDANTIDSSFVAFSDGKPEATVSGTLKRKPAKP